LPLPPNPSLTFLNAYPIPAFLAFLVACWFLLPALFFLEKIAYRPLRGAPRLVPLISAIGASIFLQNAAQLLFGPQRRNYTNPDFPDARAGLEYPIGESMVIVTYTGVFSFVLSISADDRPVPAGPAHQAGPLHARRSPG
jgi:branched-chain amino acid transport system permease protein